MVYFFRMAPGSAGLNGSLSGLLIGLLPGVPGSAVHHVSGRSLLLHRIVSNLCR